MFLISRYVCALRNGGYHTSSPSFGSLKVGALFDNANQSPIRKQARAIFPGWIELEEEDKFTVIVFRRGVLKLVVVRGWPQDCAEICRRHSWRATRKPTYRLKIKIHSRYQVDITIFNQMAAQ